MEGKDSTSSILAGGFGGASSKRLVSDASALVDLKAEVFRKYQEAKFNKLHGKNSETKVTRTESNKNAIWSKQNAGKKKTASATKRPDLRDGDDEEREKEAKVRDALTRKADMYDRMKKGKDTEHSSRFLVQFKNNDDSDDSDAADDGEWVEYKDALGRTRLCRKSELPELVKQDKDLEEYENERGRGREEDEASLQTDLLSEDMRREMLRQKWEREEEENLRKRDVHYQDVLFDEARTHGAGFYRFAKDEVARAAQREELDQLHEETEKQRQQRVRTQNKRQAKMKDRLKKVRDRKRLKMGLPLAESDSDEDKVEADRGRPEESEDDSDVDTEQNIAQGLRMMREQEEREREAKRKAAVREWDMGKEGVVMGEKFVLSQKEWVSEKRKERQHEFAPPSAYDPGRKSKANFGSFSAASTSTSQASSSKMPDFSRPPPTFASSASKSSSYTSKRVEESRDVSEPKRDPMKSLDIVGPRPREETSSNGSESDSAEQPLEPISLTDRLKLYREAATSKIPAAEAFSEASDDDDDDDDDDDVGPRQPSRGAEVAPPCDMNYYVTQRAKRPSNRMGVRTHEDLAEAISFGLQQNKAKANVTKECSDSDSE